MSDTSLIIGPSGSGKSTSMRNLDPKRTFIISVLQKPLPFRGYKKLYKPITSWDDRENNYYCTDDWQKIISCIRMIDQHRPETSVIILDDFQYLMASEYFRRASETGYTKYVELAVHVKRVVDALIATREDLSCFVLSHNEIDSQGMSKPMTIGRMLDEKLRIEGLFTCVFHSMVMDGEFKFLTQNDGARISKTPMGAFKDLYIDNDLLLIKNTLSEYYES